LYEEFARARGKSLAGEKTPDFVRQLPVLHGLMPWIRTVHIIRDGRDAALSILEWAADRKGPGRFALWREEPVGASALWWSWLTWTGIRDGAAIGSSRYTELKYEELVTAPEAVLSRIAAFLDLDFTSEMLSYHEGRRRSQPGLSAKQAWLPPRPGLRDWRTQMPERDVELFEAIAGDLLAHLGYQRAFGDISPEVAATADRCRRWWASEMPHRPIGPDVQVQH
jgi:hypothetical protein